MPDRITKKWITNDNDARAARNGCYFDLKSAEYVVEFVPSFCRHSKGEFAGKNFELLPWQRDRIFMPLFGWKRPDGTRRFRNVYVQIPKKNGKSTLASALGLYMLAGDGEQGAEVYSAATGKDQASIVHGEAINMVDSSPELSEVLRINRTTKTITFPETNSFYRALASAPRGNEGLNASCIICDELHVWYGRENWNALKWAFASRPQPILFSITTAGDDPLSVCYEQRDYALGVINGTIPDERFLGYVCEAGPKDDWTKPATWHKANPSLGVTIKVEDFRRDVEEAKRTPATQSAFKRYRLNVWSTGRAGFIEPEKWTACKRDFSAADLAGALCYGGLDLSKTRDMTALSLVFPCDGGRFRVLPFFWMPEDVVNDPGSQEYLRVWRDAGQLFTTPGPVLNYDFIEEAIGDISTRFKVAGIAYDLHFADQLTQHLEDNYGLQRVVFPQTIKEFTGPTTELERLILGELIEHDGDPILSWQIGNTNVYTDANKNRRPVKAKHGDPRTIDGVVAMIMALALALAQSNDNGPSIYDTPKRPDGLLII